MAELNPLFNAFAQHLRTAVEGKDLCIVDTDSASCGLMATVLTAGSVRKVRAALTKLNKYVVASSLQTGFLSTLGAGRGLVPQTAPLNTVLALGARDDETEGSGEPNGKQSQPMQEFSIIPPILL